MHIYFNHLFLHGFNSYDQLVWNVVMPYTAAAWQQYSNAIGDQDAVQLVWEFSKSTAVWLPFLKYNQGFFCQNERWIKTNLQQFEFMDLLNSSLISFEKCMIMLTPRANNNFGLVCVYFHIIL